MAEVGTAHAPPAFGATPPRAARRKPSGIPTKTWSIPDFLPSDPSAQNAPWAESCDACRPRPTMREGKRGWDSRSFVALCFLPMMVFIMLVGIGGETWAQTGSLTRNPVEVVKQLLTLDSKGARLGATTFEAISPYVGWGQDPVWGHVVVIDGFTVEEDVKRWEVLNTLEVVIPVTFTVLGSVYHETGTFVPERTTEDMRVRVKAVKNRWRIVEPIFPPHVGQKRMINQVRQAWLDETDQAKRDQLASLQDALKKAK